MRGNARFDFMHFMPYTRLPPNHKDYHSLWVDFPNKYYDAKEGYALYQRYLAEPALADKVGFDAIVVNEHHNTAYSMMAAPNLIAAAIIPQIKNAKICVWDAARILNIRTGSRKNTPCSTCSRRGASRLPSRSAPAWNTGPIRSIRRTHASAIAS